jgi:tRNA pseudouridine32 synthase/23S rRNA pseudouridine746 synthase
MILFENAHFLAIDKLPGRLAIPGRLAADDRRSEIEHWREEKGANLLVVHRLDFEVGGVMLFAKTPQSHQRACHWFEHRQVAKTYEAWCEVKTTTSFNPHQQLRWESKLLRGKKRTYERDFGKQAITDAEYLSFSEVRKLARWQLRPITGRAHQLRYELAKHCGPIWGDTLYGGTVPFPQEDAIALRAVKLDLSRAADAAKFDLPSQINASGIAEYFRLQF